jgi:hypothetical protein
VGSGGLGYSLMCRRLLRHTRDRVTSSSLTLGADLRPVEGTQTLRNLEYTIRLTNGSHNRRETPKSWSVSCKLAGSNANNRFASLPKLRAISALLRPFVGSPCAPSPSTFDSTFTFLSTFLSSRASTPFLSPHRAKEMPRPCRSAAKGRFTASSASQGLENLLRKCCER